MQFFRAIFASIIFYLSYRSLTIDTISVTCLLRNLEFTFPFTCISAFSPSMILLHSYLHYIVYYTYSVDVFHKCFHVLHVAKMFFSHCLAWCFGSILIRNHCICRLAIINELIDEACHTSSLEMEETVELLPLSCYGAKRKVWQMWNINFWARYGATGWDMEKRGEERRWEVRKEKGEREKMREKRRKRKREGWKRGKRKEEEGEGRGRRGGEEKGRGERKEAWCGAERHGSACLDRDVATVWPSYALLLLLYSFFEFYSFLADFSRSLFLKSQNVCYLKIFERNLRQGHST